MAQHSEAPRADIQPQEELDSAIDLCDILFPYFICATQLDILGLPDLHFAAYLYFSFSKEHKQQIQKIALLLAFTYSLQLSSLCKQHRFHLLLLALHQRKTIHKSILVASSP